MAEASKWPFQSTSLNSLTCYLSSSIVADGGDQHMASESRSVTDIYSPGVGFLRLNVIGQKG